MPLFRSMAHPLVMWPPYGPLISERLRENEGKDLEESKEEDQRRRAVAV